MNLFEQGLKKYLTKKELGTIQASKIGIGGAGGLGSNIALILTRIGFKNFEILDKDIIEPSNLNRQPYFLNEIGSPKVEVLKKHLLLINPDIQCKIIQAEWKSENAGNYFGGCPIIVEAFDQAQFKSQFIEYYQDKAKVIVSGSGMAGLYEKEPLQIKKLNNIYIVGDQKTDTDCGHPPLAPRVIACAAFMAEIVLDVVLGIKN